MSYTQDVKEELMRPTDQKHCCMLSEISALTQMLGTLSLRGGGRVRVVYRVENAQLAKRIFLLLKIRLEITPTLQFTRQARFGGRRVCVLIVQEQDSTRLLLALRMLREGEGGGLFRGAPRAAMSRKCCQGAFLRGAFLGGGSVSTPESAYRLEFALSSPDRAETLLAILRKCGIAASTIQRRGATVVYLTRGDDVSALLARIGAGRAVLAFENARIRRESRNQANRASNCDQANLVKQLDAAHRQFEYIRAYSLSKGLSGLPKPLQDVARLRLLNPDASIEQLGQMLAPPLGKSGVHHRLKKLMEALNNP